MLENKDPREREVRAAQNQSLFRTVNERLERLLEAYQSVAERMSFICECADVACVERIELQPSEYEALRKHRNRFAVRAEHVYADVERVVSANERFVTVEKIGAGGEVAVAASER